MTTGQGWTLYEDDCVERLQALPAHSVDLSVFSPPFIALYTYSASPRDMGNCSTREEFYQHFAFVVDGLRRVTKPGRLVCCHVSQVALQKARDGAIALEDFRGDVIRLFRSKGWHYHGEACIDKDPQAQAIRTKSKGLLFVQLRRDASWSRPALADYVLLFRDPGENAVPILPDITNDQWIEWARPVWYGIQESDTLSAREARGDDDERHIAPLQLGTIERCIRLWSNPGELVLSPFAGIGSEGYVALRTGRRFVGIELKPEYAATAVKNLRRAEALVHGQMEMAI
jgi:DNA modification methylase